jgi:hypothetical protein
LIQIPVKYIADLGTISWYQESNSLLCALIVICIFCKGQLCIFNYASIWLNYAIHFHLNHFFQGNNMVLICAPKHEQRIFNKPVLCWLIHWRFGNVYAYKFGICVWVYVSVEILEQGTGNNSIYLQLDYTYFQFMHSYFYFL